MPVAPNHKTLGEIFAEAVGIGTMLDNDILSGADRVERKILDEDRIGYAEEQRRRKAAESTQSRRAAHAGV